MNEDILSCSRTEAVVDYAAATGPLEVWRHSVGHGGINWKPLPPHVVDGIRRLRPHLVRVFLQEFFDVYPAPGRFDWSRLDAFLDSFARTGAKVVASIVIKPPALFPRIAPAEWRPSDVGQWQNLIRELVRRYSVERPIVTHWGVGNETDIGENGGCPYLIPNPDDFFEWYRMTTAAVLDAFPRAKVGGPSCCWVENEPLPGLIERCRRTGTRLDWVAWHRYDDNVAKHAEGVAIGRKLLEGFGAARRPEMFITEWNEGFEPVSVEDRAFAPRRAAHTAATVLAFLNAGADRTFYYHLQDQTFYHADFERFFTPAGMAGMHTHWNDIPHRFGLFGVSGDVRPQYFVYQLLSRMGEERIAARCEEPAVRVLASRGDPATEMDSDKLADGRPPVLPVTVLLVNFDQQRSGDVVATVRLENLPAGRKRLTTWRIDAARRWDEDALELLPLERREIDTRGPIRPQVFLPADSVLLLRIEPVSE